MQLVKFPKIPFLEKTIDWIEYDTTKNGERKDGETGLVFLNSLVDLAQGENPTMFRCIFTTTPSSKASQAVLGIL